MDDVAVLSIRMNISKLVRSEHCNTTVTLTVLIEIETMTNANVNAKRCYSQYIPLLWTDVSYLTHTVSQSHLSAASIYLFGMYAMQGVRDSCCVNVCMYVVARSNTITRI